MTSAMNVTPLACSSDDVRRMLLVKEGQTDELNILFQRHQRRLVQFLNRMVRDRDTAEELAQDVFLSVFMARRTYEPTAEFTTWLFRIATNRAIKWSGQRSRQYKQSLETVPAAEIRRATADRIGTPERAALERECEKHVQRAIATLPERQRVAVLMHKYEGFDYTEIADALDCSVGAVKSLLFRTHMTLRARLQHCWFES